MDHFKILKTQFEEWCAQKNTIGFDHLFLSATFKSLRGLNVFEGAIDALEVSDQISIGFLVGCGTKWGSSLCESIDPQILRSSLESALIASRYADSEPDFTLAKPESLPGGGGGQKTHDESILALSIKELEETALFLEAEAKKKSAAIFNVPHAACGYDTTETIILNSEGVGVCEENVFFKASLSCAARGEDGRVSNVSDFVVYSQLADFQAKNLVEEVASETIKRLNPQKVLSGRYLVCFDKQMSAHLLSNFQSVFSGDLLYKHMTKLEGHLGQFIASPLVDLIDSPSRGLVTHLYDAEGVVSSQKNLITKGVLNGFLHNQYTAKKVGTVTTGNADGGYGSLPGVSPNNLFWDGVTSPEK
ncbi:MAG: TldD/PmbA family protein, partial [uncultured bacterium]